MEKTDIAVPAMYGDHHVLEVRRILLAMPGVEDVYASSGFQTVQVTYDPAKANIEHLPPANCIVQSEKVLIIKGIGCQFSTNIQHELC